MKVLFDGNKVFFDEEESKISYLELKKDGNVKTICQTTEEFAKSLKWGTPKDIDCVLDLISKCNIHHDKIKLDSMDNSLWLICGNTAVRFVQDEISGEFLESFANEGIIY